MWYLKPKYVSLVNATKVNEIINISMSVIYQN